MTGNEALRAAQRLIRAQADKIPQREVGYQQYAQDRRALGYREAADLIEALIEPEEKP